MSVHILSLKKQNHTNFIKVVYHEALPCCLLTVLWVSWGGQLMAVPVFIAQDNFNLNDGNALGRMGIRSEGTFQQRMLPTPA